MSCALQRLKQQCSRNMAVLKHADDDNGDESRDVAR